MSRVQERIDVADPKAYQGKLLALVNGRDPIEILEETPGALVRIVRDHPVARLRTRPFEGKWTPNEILGHLADTEWMFGYRIRTIFCDDEPVIVGMDQERWVARQRHNDREPLDLLQNFCELRRFNVDLWKSISGEELHRIGRHSERGPESLDLMLQMQAGHDLSHIDQMQRYLAAITKPDAG